MVETRKTRYQIDRPGERTHVGNDVALIGMTIIKQKLEQIDYRWNNPTEFELDRAIPSDIGNNLDNNPKVLRFEKKNYSQDIWTPLEAALQQCGALDRLAAKFNAAVIESGEFIVIIANEEGRNMLATCARNHSMENAAARSPGKG